MLPAACRSLRASQTFRTLSQQGHGADDTFQAVDLTRTSAELILFQDK